MIKVQNVSYGNCDNRITLSIKLIIVPILRHKEWQEKY